MKDGFPCRACGAKLTFATGTDRLECAYCGEEQPIIRRRDDEPITITEQDYETWLVAAEGQAEDIEDRLTLRCEGCAAETTLEADVTAAACAYCGRDVVMTRKSEKLIRPAAVLPFHIDDKTARRAFDKWIAGLWFAPGDLKQRARERASFVGQYVPYWTFDANTTSDYTGRRGDHYYEDESYSTMEDGKMVRKKRRVRKTRWKSASGVVDVSFDDVLVLASEALPASYAGKLAPWDLENLVPYKDEYLAGFRAESYAVGLREGFGQAKSQMDMQIRVAIRRDIGGDDQRIRTVDTEHRDISFKHILLPVWMNTYRFDGKPFRFLINARTGEVQGERPWSYAKIVVFVAFLLFMGVALVLLLSAAA